MKNAVVEKRNAAVGEVAPGSRGLGGIVSDALRWCRRFWARKLAAEHLFRLDDQRLADIGITRRDIHEAVQTGAIRRC